ncbi:MAG TPA: AAA family ATPase [Thermoanaerobaculia bacterium]|nr:AAA family ATPase [Thermoanaerobaculia bacterium]
MDPALFDPDRSGTAPAVLLLDEIDKAEPDFANDLLVPLGSRQFTIPELGLVVGFPQYDSASSREPVVVITSNRERELPEAFVRRCIVLEIAPPTEQELVDIARIIYGARDDAEDYREIARAVAKSSGAATSIAEFLDTLRALEQLRAHDPTLRERIVKSTTWRVREQ